MSRDAEGLPDLQRAINRTGFSMLSRKGFDVVAVAEEKPEERRAFTDPDMDPCL